MQFVNENSLLDVSSIRTQFGEHICAHVVVANHVVNFQPRELFLELAYFLKIHIHGVLFDVPLLVDLMNHQYGVTVDE
jgi:hypothetical protein